MSYDFWRDQSGARRNNELAQTTVSKAHAALGALLRQHSETENHSDIPMKDYRTNPDRIDPNHALPRAAREVNDHCDKHGLATTVQWLKMDATLEQLQYFAEQRAFRSFAAKDFNYNMGFDPIKDEIVAQHVVQSDSWKLLAPLVIAVYMDGFTIGWRACKLHEE